MTHLPDPRRFWVGIPDERLIAARDEYRQTGDEDLMKVADDIDDDLQRRADFRRRLNEHA